MGIRFHCHHCRHELHVKDFQGGKKGRCPECQGKFRIPLQDAATSQAVGRAKATERSSPNSANKMAEAAAPGTAAPAQPAEPLQHIPAQHIPTQHNTESLDASEPKLPAAIADQPQATWHVRPVTGGRYGPAPAEIMGQWLIEGRVPRDALVWRDDWPEWQVAGDALSDYFGNEPAVNAASPTGAVASGANSVRSNAALLNSAASTTPWPVTAGGRSRLEHKQKKRQRYILIVSILSVLFLLLVAALLIVLLAPSK